MMKKLFLSCLLAFAVGASGVSSYFAAADETVSPADEPQTGTETTSEVQISTQREFRQLTADELMYEMGAGWNLGNTLESHNSAVPNETAWSAPVTTKAMLEAVHDQGYNSVRIPVTWGTMIGDAPDYEINPAWLSRVQDVVDYAISLDMYVLVNVHHDGAENQYWLTLGASDWDSVVDKYAGLWTNIAEHFKDYDEHLMFESLNEIQAAVSTQQDTTRINELNQTFVDSIRQTGGNNSQRWLAVASGYAQIHNFNSYWEMPTDEYCSVDTNRLMVKAHNYPRQDVDDSSSNSIKTALTEFRNVINEKAAARGITEKVPCLLTEFGNQTTNTSSDPRTERYGKTYLIGHANDIVCFFWDTPGEYAGGSGSYTIFDRIGLEPFEQAVPTWRAMLRAVYEDLTDEYLAGDYSDYVATPEVTAATSITLSETSLDLGINEQATVTATMDEGAVHDLVLWTSSDDDVATVTRGIVRGRSAGVATITAYSLEDSSVTATLTVKVTGEKTADSAASLSVLEETEYEDGTYVFVEYGGFKNLTVYAPEETSDILSFSSSDDGIATVNAVGKVSAVASGSATVTITASGGASKTVQVVVGPPSTATSFDVRIALNYNSQSPEYGVNGVIGDVVTVTGNGQYTLTFDLAEHRPDDMPSSITTIDAINCVYLVDEATRTGAATASPLSSADIRYDEVVIGNDTASAELGLVPDATTDPETMFRSALNGSGAFNTGGPVNAWGTDDAMNEMSIAYEGYYTIERVGGWNPVLTWTAVEDPTYITVTFTLDNVEFTSTEVDPGTPAESILGDVEEVELSLGESAELGVMVSPADTTSSVSFSSSDSTVAMVTNTKGVALDESGFATMQVYGVGAGTATITARTNNGLTTTFDVTVIDENAPLPDADENGIPDQLQQWRLYYTSANWVNVSGAVVELNGDGTYTFTISNIDLSAGLKSFYLQDATAINTGKAEYYNAIPADGVEIRVVGFKVGDTDVMDGVDADHSEFFNMDPASDGGYFDFSIINAWYAPGVVVGEPYFVHDGVETFFADDSIASATSMEVTLEIRGLGTPIALADKAALQARFDELEDVSSDGYTTDSFAAFETALTNAETVLDDLLATQEEVDGALAALNTAYEGLTLAVDKTALQTRYDELKDISSEDYTSGTFAAFETALGNAETILADAEATQEEVDGALSALNAAYEGLAEAADKAALQTRYDELKDTSSEGYTSDSFTAFETALDNAETILADTEATQEEVDAALSALNTAYEELAIEVPEPGPDDSSTADSSTSDSSTADSSTADSSAGGGSTTSSDEEGGCGSTITAAGVVIAVVSICLGAILTLRKRSER